MVINFTFQESGTTIISGVDVINISIEGDICTLLTSDPWYSNGFWHQNCTTPNKIAENYYNLTIYANTSTSDILTDTENNSVYYRLDTCTSPGSGNNWEVNMSHYCNHTVASTLTTGNLSWIGTYGYFNCSAQLNLTNRDAPPSATTFYFSTGCEIIRLIILILLIPTTIFKRKRLFKIT